MLNVGIIGSGGMGARHAVNLHALRACQVVAVMDTDPAAAGITAERVGARSTSDADELITASDIDAIVVAAPDPTHTPLALACIDAGKPALIEKPLGLSAAEAHRVVAAETDSGRRYIQVGLMREFDPQHVAVKKAVDSGQIGRKLGFRGWHRNPPQDPRPSTHHIVFGSAVHDLHSARWLLGSDPARVFAVGTAIDSDVSPELELQMITVEMKDGSIAWIEVNADCGFGYEVGVEIIGSRGMVTIAPQHTPIVRRGSGAAQRLEPDWLERFALAYEAEVEAWVNSVLTKEPVGASAWDGYVALVAADAILESLGSGAAVPVDVPERPGLYD